MTHQSDCSRTTLRISPDLRRVFSSCPGFTSPAARMTLPVSAFIVME